MTYENIMAKLKIVWSFGIGEYSSGRATLISLLYLRMVQYIGGFLSLLLFKEEEAAVLCIKDKWNIQISKILSCGIHLVIILAVTTFDFLIGQRCKYLGKDKKFIHGQYLFTVDWAHPEPNITRY